MIEFVPVRRGTELCEKAEKLYLEAFPAYERIPLGRLHDSAGTGNAEFYALMDGGFRGLTYIIQDSDFLFLLYLAIAPSERGSGLGTEALRAIQEMAAGRRMFLNIEPVVESDNYEQRARRRSFYLRNGMMEHGNVVTPDGVTYTMLCYNGDISDGESQELYMRMRSYAPFM